MCFQCLLQKQLLSTFAPSALNPKCVILQFVLFGQREKFNQNASPPSPDPVTIPVPTDWLRSHLDQSTKSLFAPNFHKTQESMCIWVHNLWVFKRRKYYMLVFDLKRFIPFVNTVKLPNNYYELMIDKPNPIHNSKKTTRQMKKTERPKREFRNVRAVSRF